MKEAPRNEQRQNLRLAGPSRHLQDIAWPILVEHSRRYGSGSVESQQIELVPRATDVIKPNERLDRFSLGEVVPEFRQRPVCALDEVVGLKPPAEKAGRRRGSAGITVLPPRINLLANLGDE